MELLKAEQPPFIKEDIKSAPPTDILTKVYIDHARYLGSDEPYKCVHFANSVLEFQPDNLDAIKLLVQRSWDYWDINETFPYLNQALKIDSSDPYLLEVYGKLSTYASEKDESIYSEVLEQIAVSNLTSIENIIMLLKSKLRWIRKKAASNIKIDLSKIEQAIPSPDRYVFEGYLDNPNCSDEQKQTIATQLADTEKYPSERDKYVIGYGSNLGVSEIVLGLVDIKTIEEIFKNTDDFWSEFDWYNYDDLLHEYGTSQLPDKLLMPDGSTEEISLNKDSQMKANEFNLEKFIPKQGSGIFHLSKSSEVARDAWLNWKKYTISLEYEGLNSGKISAIFSEANILEGLEYDGRDGIIEFELTESAETIGKDTEHQLYSYGNGAYSETEAERILKQ